MVNAFNSIVNVVTHISDGIPTPMAPRAVIFSVADDAVYTSVVLVELGSVYRLVTGVAGEVLWVPLLVQGCHYLE